MIYIKHVNPSENLVGTEIYSAAYSYFDISPVVTATMCGSFASMKIKHLLLTDAFPETTHPRCSSGSRQLPLINPASRTGTHLEQITEQRQLVLDGKTRHSKSRSEGKTSGRAAGKNQHSTLARVESFHAADFHYFYGLAVSLNAHIAAAMCE